MNQLEISDHLKSLDEFHNSIIKLRYRFQSGNVRHKDKLRLVLLTKLHKTYKNLKEKPEMSLSDLYETKNSQEKSSSSINDNKQEKEDNDDKEEKIILELSDDEKEELSDTEEVYTMRKNARNIYRRNVIEKMMVNADTIDTSEESIKTLCDFIEINSLIRKEELAQIQV